MSDFVNGFWGISSPSSPWAAWSGACGCCTRSVAGSAPSRPTAVEDTGHVWDGDLTELNNPVPSWWTWMYLLACVFALGYLFFMPGLGEYKGSLGYSSAEEVARNRQAGRGGAPHLCAFRDHDRAADRRRPRRA